MSIRVEDLRHFCHIFQVPKTCENFIKLCSTGYYDNTSKKTENFQVVSFFLCLSRCYCSYVWYKQLICIFIFLLVFHRSIRNFMVCAKVASFLTYSSCACCLVWNITSAGNWVYQQSPQGLKTKCDRRWSNFRLYWTKICTRVILKYFTVIFTFS